MGHLISFKLKSLPVGRGPPSPPTKKMALVSSPVSTLSKPTTRSRTNPVTNLTILPYTHEQWTVVMEEVRRLYLKGHYKQCAARCRQILDGIEDPYCLHPLYSIYLSFFAASSMETTAFSMSNHSSDKLPLLQQALSYYLKASSHIEFASLSVDPTVTGLAHRSNTPSLSSARSSVDSIFSHSDFLARSLSSTPVEDIERAVSPSSIASLERKRPKKKVSFSDDFQEGAEPSTTSLLDNFPRPPSPESPTCSSLIIHSPTPKPTTASESDDGKYKTYSSFLLAQSIARYRTQLASLASQLQYHTTSIQSQIANVSSVGQNRRGGVICAWSAMEGPGREEMERVELKERIQRLKAGGWQRKRFDPERYRVLCQAAIVEVDMRA